MPKFKCPGNEVDGPCGAITEGKRRPEPNTEIAVLEKHMNKITDKVCRRRYVWFNECLMPSKTEVSK